MAWPEPRGPVSKSFLPMQDISTGVGLFDGRLVLAADHDGEIAGDGARAGAGHRRVDQHRARSSAMTGTQARRCRRARMSSCRPRSARFRLIALAKAPGRRPRSGPGAHDLAGGQHGDDFTSLSATSGEAWPLLGRRAPRRSGRRARRPRRTPSPRGPPLIRCGRPWASPCCLCR